MFPTSCAIIVVTDCLQTPCFVSDSTTKVLHKTDRDRWGNRVTTGISFIKTKYFIYFTFKVYPLISFVYDYMLYIHEESRNSDEDEVFNKYL